MMASTFNLPQGWRVRLVALGPLRAMFLLTAFCVLASLLCTVLLMKLMGSEPYQLARGLFIGAAVPAVVAPAASYWLLCLLSELEHTRAALAASVLRDSLTNVYNRLYFMQQLEREVLQAQRSGAPLSLLMLDVDHFKHINDAHGHQVGDRVLQQIAGACGFCLRPYDVLARVGGEEFALLLPGTPLTDAGVIAERVRAHVGGLRVDALPADGAPVTVSIGVSSLAAGDSSGAIAIKRADDALYRAKREGRNRCIVAEA